MPFNFNNSMEDVEKYLQQRGLSIGTPEYEQQYNAFKIRKDLNTLFGVPNTSRMMDLNELASVDKNAKYIRDYVRNDKEGALDFLYNDRYGILNDYMVEVDKKDPETGELIINQETGEPEKEFRSIGYFNALLKRDKKIEKDLEEDYFDSYDNSEEHKKISKEIEDYKHLLNQPSTYTSEYNPAPAYLKHIKKLEELDDAKRKEYVNENKIGEYVEKYKNLLDNDPETKKIIVDEFYENVKNNDQRFTEYIDYEHTDRAVKNEELIKANIESILPEFFARQTLDNSSNSEKIGNWYQNRLMDNLNQIQPTTQMLLRSAAKFGDIIVESAAYLGGVKDAVFGDYKEVEVVNSETGKKEKKLVVTIEDEEGHEFETILENTFLNRFLNSDKIKYALGIEETGAWSKEKQKELKEKGLNKHAIYSVGEDKDLIDQLLNRSTLAEAGAQTAFTVATAGEGALASVLMKRGLKLTAKGLTGLALRMTNSATKGLNVARKLQIGNDIIIGLTNASVAGTSEAFFNANETYRNSLDRNIKEILQHTGNIMYNPETTTDEEIKRMPLYKDVLNKLKDDVSDNNNLSNLDKISLSINPNSPAFEEDATEKTRELLDNLIQKAAYEASVASVSDFWKNACTNGFIMAAFKSSLQIPSVQRATAGNIGKIHNWGGRITSSGNAGNVGFNFGYTGLKYAARPTSRMLAESAEEGIQNVWDLSSVAGANYAFDSYLNNQLYGDGSIKIGDNISGRFYASFDAFKDAFYDKNTWREAAMGGIGAILPTPMLGFGKNMIRKSSRQRGDDESAFSYGYRMSPIKTSIIDEIMEMKSEERQMNKLLESTANHFNSDEFKENFRTFAFLGNLDNNLNGNGFEEDKTFNEFLAKTAILLDNVKDTEFGKSMFAYLNKMSNTNFESSDVEDMKFIQSQIDEYKKSELFEKSKNKKEDKDIYLEKQQAAKRMLDVIEKAEESNEYIESIYGNKIDPFLKDYLSHIHLMVNLLQENSNAVNREISDVMSNIDDLNIEETENKIHFSDLSDDFKNKFISYGSNYNVVRNAWISANKQYEELEKRADRSEGVNKRLLTRQLKQYKKELDSLKQYLNFLNKNEGNLDIFINTKQIANLSANQRNTFLNRKDERKQKYNNKQNSILNHIQKKSNEIIKSRISNGNNISINWLKEASQYAANAELYTESALNDLQNVLVNPDQYLTYAREEAILRGREQGQKEGKEYNFDSGKDLWNFLTKLKKPSQYPSVFLGVEEAKEKARFEGLVEAVLNKKNHEGHEKAIDEYNEMKKKYKTYLETRTKLGSVGYSSDKSDRAVAHSVFLFLIYNGINTSNLEACKNFLQAHKDDYEKFVDDWNNNKENKLNGIPVYSFEDEYIDEQGEEESTIIKRDGVVSVFEREFNAIEKYEKILNNIENENNGINKKDNQSQQQEQSKKQEQQKDNRSDAEVAFGKNNLTLLKNDYELSKDEYKRVEDFIGEYGIKNFEELENKLKKLDEFKDIYEKIKLKNKQNEKEERQKKQDLKRESIQIENVIFRPGRTMGLEGESLSLQGNIYSSENIKWLSENINTLSDEKEREHYRKVIDFYNNYIFPNIQTIYNINVNDDVFVYRDDAGLYIVMTDAEDGNYTINDNKYKPLAVMPSINDSFQQGNRSFDKYRYLTEPGFVTDNDGNPIVFNITKKIIDNSYYKEEFVDLRDLVVNENDSNFVKNFKRSNIVQLLEVERANAHKALSYNTETGFKFVRIKSLFEAKANIDGENKNIVSLFEDKNPNILYLDSLFSNPLFKGFYWSIEDALNGVDKDGKELDYDARIKKLKKRLPEFFFLTEKYEYKPYFEDGNLVLSIGRGETTFNLGENNNPLSIKIGKDGKYNEVDIKKTIYDFFRVLMYNNDNSLYKVDENDPHTNSRFTIQLNIENVKKLKEHLADVEGDYEKLDDVDKMAYDRFNYLLNNNILYAKKDNNKTEYHGIKITEKTENKELKEVEDLISLAKTTQQKNVLQEILKIQSEKRQKKEKARDSKGDYTTATKESYDNVGNVTNTSSIHIGDEFDQLCRDFFAGKIHSNKNNEFFLIKDSENINVEDYYGFNKNVLYNILQELNKIVTSHPDFVFITNDLYLLEEIEIDGENKLCAGELDMIAVDELGQVHVYDFKTGFSRNDVAWKKQTNIYDLLLEKRNLKVATTNIIYSQTELNESELSAQPMTVDSLLKSEKGRKILEKRFNLVLKNNDGEDVDIPSNLKQVINEQIHILGFDNGIIIDDIKIDNPIIINMTKDNIIEKKTEQSAENKEECETINVIDFNAPIN